MAMLDRLYTPSIKDIASGSKALRFFSRTALTVTNTAVALTRADAETLSADLCRHVTGMHWEMSSAVAGQFPTTVSALLYDRGAPDQLVCSVGMGIPTMTGLNGSFAQLYSLDLDILQFPGQGWTFNSTFNLGVSQNQMIVYWTGWEFPRGQLRR